MSDEKTPLEPLRNAHEDEWFRKKNQELIDRMKSQLERQQTTAELANATGVQDQALLDQLADLGITRETARILHLVPLLQVAWADGEIQDNERDLLVEAANRTGVTEGPAREAFDKMLQKRPDPAFFQGALNFLKAMLAALPGEEGARTCKDLTDLAWRVANASGGLFGLFGKVDDNEEEVLKQIAGKLGESFPEATKKLLDKIS